MHSFFLTCISSEFPGDTCTYRFQIFSASKKPKLYFFIPFFEAPSIFAKPIIYVKCTDTEGTSKTSQDLRMEGATAFLSLVYLCVIGNFMNKIMFLCEKLNQNDEAMLFLSPLQEKRRFL